MSPVPTSFVAARPGVPSGVSGCPRGPRCGTVAVLGAVLLAFGIQASDTAPVPVPRNLTPDDALKAYRRGRFEESQRDYSALAQERPDDARLRFNAGAAAYRQNDLTNAARWFESVTAAPDLRLQQQAYYNLGNTRYRLGESVQDPREKQQLWREALTNFTAAAKLDQSDTNAVGNLAYVKQRLEQLAQQEPPPPQQQQNQDQKKNNQDKNKDDKKSQDPKSKDGGSQDPSEGNPDDSKNSKGDSKGKQSSESKSGNDGSDPSKPDSSESKSGKEDAGKEGREPGADEKKSAQEGKDGRQGADPKSGAEAGEGGAGQEVGGEVKAGEMTKAQAVQLLENQKDDEKALMLRSAGGKKDAERAARVRKPW